MVKITSVNLEIDMAAANAKTKSPGKLKGYLRSMELNTSQSVQKSQNSWVTMSIQIPHTQ